MKTRSFFVAAALLVQLSTLQPVVGGPGDLPSYRTFGDVSSVVGVLPETLPLKQQGTWSAPLVAEASALIQRDAQQQQIIIRSTVEVLQPLDGGFRLKLPDGEVRHGGNMFGFRIFAYFSAFADQKLADVSPGDTVVLTGVMRRADLQFCEGDPWPSLCIDIAHPAVYVDPDTARRALERRSARP